MESGWASEQVLLLWAVNQTLLSDYVFIHRVCDGTWVWVNSQLDYNSQTIFSHAGGM